MSIALSNSLDALAGRVRGAGHVLLFCDLDGPLADVYDRSTSPAVSPEVGRPLTDLVATGRVTATLLTGRAASDMRSRLVLPGLIIAGNHGLEMSGPDWAYVDPSVTENLKSIDELSNELTRAVETIPGTIVEHKGLSVAVRMHDVAPDQQDVVRAAVHRVLGGASHPFVLMTGQSALEIRPRVYWNKGQSVRWIIDRLKLPNYLAIFVGGDPTDEDAFAALEEGITISIGQACESAAQFCVDGPDGVRSFLEWLRDQLH